MSNDVVNLDRARAIRFARVVRSWHEPDDDAGAYDCFIGMNRGEFEEWELEAIWREAIKPRAT
jgi:hypothetical protein